MPGWLKCLKIKMSRRSKCKECKKIPGRKKVRKLNMSGMYKNQEGQNVRKVKMSGKSKCMEHQQNFGSSKCQ